MRVFHFLSPGSGVLLLKAQSKAAVVGSPSHNPAARDVCFFQRKLKITPRLFVEHLTRADEQRRRERAAQLIQMVRDVPLVVPQRHAHHHKGTSTPPHPTHTVIKPPPPSLFRRHCFKGAYHNQYLTRRHHTRIRTTVRKKNQRDRVDPLTAKNPISDSVVEHAYGTAQRLLRRAKK